MARFDHNRKPRYPQIDVGNTIIASKHYAKHFNLPFCCRTNELPELIEAVKPGSRSSTWTSAHQRKHVVNVDHLQTYFKAIRHRFEPCTY